MARALKILSDFDGVWTNQGPEAVVLLEHTIGKLAGLASRPSQDIVSELQTVRQQMAAAPARNGWAPDGRISAYLDEDPLVESSALCHYIDRGEDALAKELREAVLAAGFDSLAALSETVFREATAKFRAEHPPCLVDDAAGLMASLRDTGAEVVIISNSGADKISAWLQNAGIDAGPSERHTVRVRGAAAKWKLGDTDQAIEVAGRSIHVDRPLYRAAIEAENPDLIIGDVFSLDLALPHVMRQAENPAAPRRLALRRHAHTPAWVTESRAGGAIDHVVAGVEELPAILREL